MEIGRVTGLCLGLIFMASSAYGDEIPWTDLRVRELARRRAPEVRQSAAVLEIARAEGVFGETSRVGNPTLGVIVLPGFPDEGALTVGASLAVPLEVGGERGHSRREAERALRSAEARLDHARSEAEASARLGRVEVALATRAVEMQTARLSVARENLASVTRRVLAGASTAVDLGLAEQESALAEADLAEAERVLEARAMVFRRSLDLRAMDRVLVSPVGVPEAMDLEGLDAAVTRALSARRDLPAHELAAARFTQSDRRWRAGAIGALWVGLEAQQVSIGNGQVANSVGASVRWELPLWQRAQGPRAVARAEAARERVSAELLRRDIAREVVSQALGLSHALAAYMAIEARAVPAGERMVAATEASWQAGALDYFRVITARRELLLTRARALEALRAAWQTRIELDRAMGGAP